MTKTAPPQSQRNAPRPPAVRADNGGVSEGVRSIDLLVTPMLHNFGESPGQICRALARAGVNALATALPRPDDTQVGRVYGRPAAEAGSDVLIQYTEAKSWTRPQARPSFGIAAFASDTVPPGSVNGFRNVREIWVPSQYLADIIELTDGDGFNRNVHVIPFGIGSVFTTYRRRVRGAKLRFLHFCSDVNETRKGADLAQKAFRAAFPGRTDVELVIHSGRQNANAATKSDARVQYVARPVIPSAAASMYHEFDALLFPSRGEAFGTIPLEAMATGLPAIFPDSSGMHAFAEMGLTVSTVRAPAFVQNGRTTERMGMWWEPSLDELVERLKEVDEDYERVMDDVALSAETIAQVWTWDATAEKMIARMNAPDEAID